MTRFVINVCLLFGILFVIGFIGTMWLGCYLSDQWFMAICWQGVVLMAAAITLFIIAAVLIREHGYGRF